MEQKNYKDMQSVFKEIAIKALLDKEFRELCLKDSKEAIKVVNGSILMPENVIFLEEDGELIPSNCYAYVLPPFLKSSWLLSK